MTSNRSSRPVSLVAIAIAIVFAVALAGCGGGGETQLSDAGVRPSVDGEIDPDQPPPELLADKEIPSTCGNDLGTGDPVFEAAFCDYREAALSATSGPDGVTGIDTSLLSAGDEALALYPSDPAGALAMLESAAAGLAG